MKISIQNIIQLISVSLDEPGTFLIEGITIHKCTLRSFFSCSSLFSSSSNSAFEDGADGFKSALESSRFSASLCRCTSAFVFRLVSSNGELGENGEVGCRSKVGFSEVSCIFCSELEGKSRFSSSWERNPCCRLGCSLPFFLETG